MTGNTGQIKLEALAEEVARIQTLKYAHLNPRVDYDSESDSWHMSVELYFEGDLDFPTYREVFERHMKLNNVDMDRIEWDITDGASPTYVTATYYDPDWES